MSNSSLAPLLASAAKAIDPEKRNALLSDLATLKTDDDDAVSQDPKWFLPLDAHGLPFGMQIAAQPYAEERLLDVAAWCENVLAFTASPATAGNK
jgi:Asp-tRNA(Asn)/Glu-tRNA(Gln) amidotransferase A subunit family amidase